MTATRGIIIAATASATGKTTVTLGLLKLLADRGVPVRAAKSGPDYLDPTFQTAACGRPSINLDAWAMPVPGLQALAAGGGEAGESLLIVEGAMGVLDGAGPSRSGSVADLSRVLGLPVVLVIDASGASDSAVLPVLGLRAALPDLVVCGVVLNRLGSERHAALVRAAMARHDIPVFGALMRDERLTLPSRHLGLIPAGEHPGIDEFLAHAAGAIEKAIDVETLIAAARPPITPADEGAFTAPAPPGRRIAIAQDDAFLFAYSHQIEHWRRCGAEVSFFSPLADEAPGHDADCVFLPGGYPELHAGRLAAAGRFRAGMQVAASRNVMIYGECGGYMALGQELADRNGHRHRMLGLLPHSTSFAQPKLHLGYRFLRALDGSPFPGVLAGHDFHYTTNETPTGGRPLFFAYDADANEIGPIGQVRGTVSGSYAHVICPADRSRGDLPGGCR